MARTSEAEPEVQEGERRELAEPEDTPKRNEQRPSKPKRNLMPWALAGVLLLVLVGGYFWLHGRNRESTDDAQVDGHIAPVASKVAGSVVEVLVDYNQPVKAGQTLVRLDPRDFQAKVDQAKAALAAAVAQANAARSTVPLTRATTASGTTGAAAQVAAAQAMFEQSQIAARQATTSGIAAAQAAVAVAEANSRKAQADLDRMQQLVAKEEISRQQFDTYTAAAQVAAAQLRSAQEQLNAARQGAERSGAEAQAAQARVLQARASLEESRAGQQQVQVSQAQAASAAAAIEQARANLAAAELNLSYCTLTAPLDGVVTQKSVEPGQMIQPGQSLMTVVPLNNVWVSANFKETQLANVRPGQRAEIKVDMYGQRIAGRVDSISGTTGARSSLLPPENASGNFVKVVQRIPVKIVFDNLPQGVVLRPGMNVDATIFTK